MVVAYELINMSVYSVESVNYRNLPHETGHFATKHFTLHVIIQLIVSE